MSTQTLKVNKGEVYGSVAEASAYEGSKSEKEGDYQKVSSVDEDKSLFEGYWIEACDFATNIFRPFLGSVSNAGEIYSASLDLPDNFDDSLVDSMNTSLFSYFAAYVKSKWFAVVKPEKAKEYAETATAMLNDVKTKMYNRKRPQRLISKK